MSLLLVVSGIAIIVFGANWLVEGASSIAKKLSIPDIVIGLTIVAFGTSAPELTVSVLAAVSDKTDIAIGNVLGSNIFNVFVILGIAALIYPVEVRSNTIWKEIPFSLLAALVLGVAANDVFFDKASHNRVSSSEGWMMIGFLCIFVYYTFLVAQKSKENKVVVEEFKVKELNNFLSVLYIIIGLIGLIVGGDLLVDGAVDIAAGLGMSQAVIGLTIVAAGTSMPELATSAVAAYKKKSDIAMGNVVGSNIFNIFLILGISATINPLPFRPEANIDILMTILASVMMFTFTLIGTGRKISRVEGGVLVAIYLFYVSYLLIQIA